MKFYLYNKYNKTVLFQPSLVSMHTICSKSTPNKITKKYVYFLYFILSKSNDIISGLN